MTIEENTKLKEFVDYYKNQHTKIANTESKINILTTEIKSMLNELTLKRKEELNFIEELKNKYNEEELNKCFLEINSSTNN